MPEFLVTWYNTDGHPVDSEIITNHSKSVAIARIGGRFVNRTEPQYACGFFLREALDSDTPTLLGSLQQRRGRGESW
jgi:hypothetical protein